MGINNVIISGNLTRDAELRVTQSDWKVLGFGVAVNDYRLSRETGDWEEYPNFVDCTLFGNRAAALHRHLRKGTKVCLRGRLRWSSWEKEGARRSKLEVVVDELEFLSPRRDDFVPAPVSASVPSAPVPASDPAHAPDSAPPAPAPVPAPDDGAPCGEPPSSGVYDERIPF